MLEIVASFVGSIVKALWAGVLILNAHARNPAPGSSLTLVVTGGRQNFWSRRKESNTSSADYGSAVLPLNYTGEWRYHQQTRSHVSFVLGFDDLLATDMLKQRDLI